MEVRDVGRRAFERGIDAGVTGGRQLPEPVPPDGFQNRIHPVKLPRILKQGVIPPGTDAVENRRDSGGHFAVHLPAARGQLFEKGVFGFPIRFHQWHYHIHAQSFPRAGEVCLFGAANMSVMNGKSTKPV